MIVFKHFLYLLFPYQFSLGKSELISLYSMYAAKIYLFKKTHTHTHSCLSLTNEHCVLDIVPQNAYTALKTYTHRAKVWIHTVLYTHHITIQDIALRQHSLCYAFHTHKATCSEVKHTVLHTVLHAVYTAHHLRRCVVPHRDGYSTTLRTLYYISYHPVLQALHQFSLFCTRKL